ncbi:hypothetical protein ABPG72_009324 [Tetrahymena utriculariae]
MLSSAQNNTFVSCVSDSQILSIIKSNSTYAVAFILNKIDCLGKSFFNGTVLLFTYGDLFNIDYFNQYTVFSDRDDCFEQETISQIDDMQNTYYYQLASMVFLDNNCYDSYRQCQPNVNCVKCSQGYCLQQYYYQNECYKVESLSNFVGVDNQNFCQYYEQININCYDWISEVCKYQLDKSQQKCTLLTQDPNIIGKTIYNNCYFTGYTTEEIIYCKPKYCILFGINGYSCQNIDFSTYIIGSDPNYKCLLPNSNNAKNCRYGFCIIQNDQGSFCVQLDPNIEQQVAKNASNDFCQSFYQQQNDSVNCANNYCLDTDQNCVLLSNQDGQRGKIFYTDRCSDYGGNENLIQCVKGFCIDNNQCKPISGIFLGKDINQKCVTSLQCSNNPIPQLIECQFSQEICYDRSFNQCYFLNGVIGAGCSSISLVQMYGADIDGNCLQLYQMQAIKCSSGYCIRNNSCKPYDLNYVGRDEKYQCLQQMQTAAIECKQQYCIMKKGTISAYCIKVDRYNNVIGISQSDLQSCITTDSPQQQASVCAIGQYCKDPQTSYCIQMQQGICQYYDTTCIIINNNPLNLTCYQCDPTSCLYLNNQCIPITAENQLCINQNGYCQYYKSNNCKSCPEQTCKNNSLQTCVEMTNIQLLSNECLVKLRSDIPCEIVDTNQYLNQILANPSYLIQCTNTLRMCQNIQNNSQFCQSCPINFIQPGNGKCYSLQEQQDILDKKDTFYSFLDVVYISESIGVEDSQQCPQNCFSCQSKTICTKCSYNYYLIEINSQKIICISIKNFQSINYSLDYYETQFYKQDSIFIQCTQDGINNGFIQDEYSFPLSVQQVQYYDYISNRLLSQNSLINCQNFIQFELNNNTNKIVSLEFLKQVNIYYQISPSTVFTDGFFQFFQDNKCDIQCNQCFYNQIANQHQCLKCNIGYALDYSGQCIKCPKNCNNCLFGGFYNQQSINWSENQQLYSSQFLSQLSSDEYSLRCNQCQQGFTVQPSYRGCDPCGQNCINCYTGMPNYNHSNQLNFDPIFLSVATLIKKCVECSNPLYKFSDDMNCQPTTISNCQIEYNVVQTIYPYILSNYSWKLNFDVAPYCYQCAQTFFNVQNQKCFRSRDTCNNISNKNNYKQCVNTTVNINLQKFTSKCLNLLFQDIDDSNPIYCYQCLTNMCQYHQFTQYFDSLNTKPVSCSQNILNCVYCYSYVDKKTFSQIYQCIQCEDNYVITLQGCLPCPPGCVDCFYSNGIINFSDQFAYNQPFYSLDFRLNLLSDNKAYLFCISCQDNYYYKDYKCIQLQCDQTCQSCQLYKNTIFKCLQCNQQYLMSQINNIIGYISLFHLFGSRNNTIIDFSSMLNFGSNHSACHICPYSCQVCEKVGETINNPFNIYSALCKKCKDNFPIPQIIEQNERSNYKWVYDSQRQKCILCLKTDQGCTYQIVTRQIYGTCSSNQDSIGDGTKDNPLNIQRSSEINWDQIIINQQDFTKYLVFYNEMSIEFIDVQLIINQNECRLFQKIQIKTDIQKYILGLQRFSLTITNYAQTQMILESISPIQISGFTQVNFLNLQLLTLSQNSYFSNQQFGFIINNSLLKSVNFTNVSILNKYQIPNNFLFEFDNIMDVFSLQNVNIQGFLVNQQNFFNLVFTQQLTNPRMLFIVHNTSLINMSFSQGSFVQLYAGNLYIEFKGLQILNSSFSNRSIILNIQSNIDNKSTYQILDDISIYNNQISQNSQFYAFNYFVINQINNLTLQFNNFTSQQQNSLFQQNLLQLSKLVIFDNTFINYIIFEVYQQPKIVYVNQLNFFLNDITVQQNIINSSGGLIFKLIGNSKQLVDQIKINLLNVKVDNIFLANITSVFINIQYAISFTLSKFTVNNSYFSEILAIRNIQSLFLSDGFVTGIQILLCDQFVINNVHQSLTINKLQIINILSKATIFTITNREAENQNLVIEIQDLNAVNNQFSVNDLINNVGMFIINNKEQATTRLININLSQNNLASLVSSFVKYLQTSPGFYIVNLKGQLYIENINFIDNQTELTSPSIYFISLDIQMKNAQFQTLKSQPKNYELQGGFAYLQADQIQIKDSSFVGQEAINGGALYICSTGLGELLIRNSSFQNNSALINNQNSKGGAIYIQTNLANYLDITVEYGSFQNNFALYGAVFYIEKTNVTTFINFNHINFEDNFSIVQSIILFIDGFTNQKIIIMLQDCQVFNTIYNMKEQIQLMNTTLSSTYIQNKQYFYFYINQAQQVTITNLNFQQTFSLLDLDLDLISMQMNLPIPIQVINTQFYQNTFSQYQMTTTDYEMMHVEANQISLANNIFYKIQSLLGNQQLIKLKANQIDISNTVLDNLNCLRCEYGNLNLEISGQAYIESSIFKNNICQNGGGIYLQSSIAEPQSSLSKRLLNNQYNPIKFVQMFLNQFQNNTSLGDGGAIYALNIQIIILNTTINQNIANQLGGGIYNKIETSLLTDQILLNYYQLFNIILQNTYIIYNVAQIGGGYYSLFNIPQTQNSFILGNKAYQFGSDISSFPSSYQVYYNNVLVKQDGTVTIPSSGKAGDFFTVFLMSYDKNQIYKTISDDDITLYVNITNSSQNNNFLLRNNKITFTDNLFDLSNLEIYGKFKQKFRISLFCDQVKHAIYKQGVISQILANITFTFYIQIINECPVGFKSTQINNTYDSCVTCIDKTYSIQPGQSICQKCQSDEFKCSLNNIGLPDGYYRLNNNTDVIKYCSDWPQNCIGDISRDTSLLNIQRFGNWNIYYCAEGSTGVFCLDCDYVGKFWKKSYMKYQQYSCQECNSQNILQNIFVAIVNQMAHLIFIVYLISIIWNNLFEVHMKCPLNNLLVLSEYIDKLNEKLQRNNNQRIVTIKIIICYFQLLFLITQLQLQIPWPFTFFLMFLSRQNEFILRSLDCFVKDTIPLAYIKLFISQAHIFLIIVLTYFISYVIILIRFKIVQNTKENIQKKQEGQNGINRQKIFQQWNQIRKKYDFTRKFKIQFFNLITSFTYFVYSPSIIDILSSNIICNEIDDYSYNSYSTQIKCDENHNKWSYYIFIPLLIFWAILIPLAKIAIVKKYTKSLSVIFSFNHFSSGYKEDQSYYWDLFRQIQIFLLIIILKIQLADSVQKISLLLALFVCQKLIQIILSPYKTTSMEKLCIRQMDVSIFTITLMVFISDSIQNQNILILVICGVTLILINLYFVSQVIVKFLTKKQIDSILSFCNFPKNKQVISTAKQYWNLLKQIFETLKFKNMLKEEYKKQIEEIKLFYIEGKQKNQLNLKINQKSIQY